MGAQTVGELHSDKSSGAQGRFSPDGSKFAWYHPWNGIFMFEFDRSTGTLSDFNKIEVSQGANQNGFAGLEFSPSGRFLYISNYFSLFQLDMKAEDLAASLTHIADYDGFADPEPFYTSFLYMARTQDKRIFMNPQSGSQWLHVIQEPEKKGVDCRFEQHVIQLPTVNNFAFPFFPTYTLGALGEPLCDTMTVADGFVSPNTLGLSVYPVPVDNTLYLNADTEISGASIYSVTGRLLSSYHQPNISSLDVTMLPMGLYFLHVTNKVGQRAVLRFCKN